MCELSHKRGDTFELQCTYRDAGGVPVNLDDAGVVITSQLRDSSGELVGTCTVTPEDQDALPGQFRVRVDDTSAWPLARLNCDLKLVAGDNIQRTRTFSFPVHDQVTE